MISATVRHDAPLYFHPIKLATRVRSFELTAMTNDGTNSPIIAAARVTCTLGMIAVF
jgi:hypothetical protein